MFRSLLIFRGHSAREPASTVCNDEQGDLTQEPASATADTGKTMGEGLGKK